MVDIKGACSIQCGIVTLKDIDNQTRLEVKTRDFDLPFTALLNPKTFSRTVEGLGWEKIHVHIYIPTNLVVQQNAARAVQQLRFDLIIEIVVRRRDSLLQHDMGGGQGWPF